MLCPLSDLIRSFQVGFKEKSREKSSKKKVFSLETFG